MRHRIRAAALVLDADQRVLLVKHTDPLDGVVFWVPPGGGIKDAESIYDCVQREVWEETNLTADVGAGRIAYVRQFADTVRGVHHMEIYVLATTHGGEIAIHNVAGEEDEDWISEARFIPRSEVVSLNVFPQILRDEFWDDLAAGFPTTRYLGVDIE